MSVEPSSLTVYVSASHRTRLENARAALGDLRQHRSITIIGATRGAADDFARQLAASTAATFGISRFSLTQFAARTALLALARQSTTPSTGLVTEAVATRAAFDAVHADRLGYFGPVARTPGFPRALSRTLGELRGAGVTADRLSGVADVGEDLRQLLQHFEHAVADAGASDRARLFTVAAQVLSTARQATTVLLDLPVTDHVERRLIEAIIGGASPAIVTVAAGDALDEWLRGLGGTIVRDDDEGASDLRQLRRHLFESDSTPPARPLDGSLEWFSAPGEGRECVEIARRILREARRGVRFDEMAVLVRSSHAYYGLLEHAMTRAGVPAWFERGTRRPHPAGRAFLALLACASERISAPRFAEYLSLAQVPDDALGTSLWEPPRDDTAWRGHEREDDEAETEDREERQLPASADAAVLSGTLRAPWRWEKLIVDARVVGGEAARWKRRLEGYRHELGRQLTAAGKEEGAEGSESPEGARVEATLRQLEHLLRFALPIVETLESWQGMATWGEWLDRFIALAPRVLRHPAYVARVLAELRPMAAVGPVGLDEVRRVLAERLLTVEAEPPARRYGRVFVGTPHQARARTFRVVFVPGLAERLFPHKVREDPLLLDTHREALDVGMAREADRIARERQLLRLAVGAASERLCVSYPRIELSEARARVPSFYALDLLRAATGRVPAHETLEEDARKAAGATLAWPAPAEPSLAIDEVEHDLAVLRRLLDEPDAANVRGHAHYLLTVSESLRRSVIERWRRATVEWTPGDGLCRVTPSTADVLAAQRLGARAYSPSALQRFASCPYQFALSAFLKLQPLQEPVPLERLDPLTRGSLVHDILARLMRELRDAGSLPLTANALPRVREQLDNVIAAVTARARDDLAPAVERVWNDDVEAIRRDVHGWLERMAEERDWLPRYFEYGFGRIPGERDEASSHEPVPVGDGYALRGAIDLIEVHTATGELRVTDYKTGRPPDKLDTLRIGGGTVLQPVLYGLAAEKALGRPAREGRLFYCTTGAGYRAHAIALDADARRGGFEVLEIIDRAIAAGRLMAAPQEHACDRCDFGVVCGRDVGRRTAHKQRTPLADLIELRSRR